MGHFNIEARIILHNKSLFIFIVTLFTKKPCTPYFGRIIILRSTMGGGAKNRLFISKKRLGPALIT